MELLKQVHAIIDTGAPPSAAERDRLTRLSRLLATPIERPARRATVVRPVIGETGRPSSLVLGPVLRVVASRNVTPRSCNNANHCE